MVWRPFKCEGDRYGKLTAIKFVDPPYRYKGRIKSKNVYCTCACGGSVVVRHDNLANGKVGSCGCVKPGFKAALLSEKFERNVDRTGGPDGCWPWKGALSSSGYGLIEKGKLAHRYAWETYNGRPLGVGLFACHTCDNPPCVNPRHLFEGSHQDNMTDSARKGRKRLKTDGEKNGHAAFTNEQVVEIRKELAAGMSRGVLAKKHGVARSTIKRIGREGPKRSYPDAV